MPRTTSDFEFRQQASLSQRVGFQIPIVQQLAGSDTEISESIGILLYVTDKENETLLSEEPEKWIIGLLNVIRLARFCTSEKTNEISKMGFMLPAEKKVYSGEYDEEGLV